MVKEGASLLVTVSSGSAAALNIEAFNPKAEIVAEEYPKFGASDFTPSVNKLLAAKPDYVYTMLFGNDLITFSKQATAVGFFKQIDNRFIGMCDGNSLKAIGDDAAFTL